MFDAIATHILRHAREGSWPTIVDGMTLFRISSSLVAGSGVMQPSVCFPIQGEKIAHADATLIRYRAGDFLISSIDMPLVGQPIGATHARPYLAIAFALPPHAVLEIGACIGREGRALSVGTCDEPLLDVVLRSVRSLDDPREAQFLAPLLRRELVYRLVTGRSGAAVIASARLTSPADSTGRAIAWIRAHFREPFDMRSLARIAGTSVSTLHRKFKAAVLMGPLQYQKRLRLEEARRLLLAGSDATRAAFEVGYESPSQFTREYRRQFGLPPLRDRKRIVQETATIGQVRRASRT